MKEWRATFLGNLNVRERVDLPLECFDDMVAAKTFEIDGRRILGMWIEDRESEHDFVYKIYGRVPEDVLECHRGFLTWQEESRPRLTNEEKAPPERG